MDLADKENAEDMRLRAVETLRKTQKTIPEAGGNHPKERSNGSEGFRFLQEKMEYDRWGKEKELEIRTKTGL